MEDPSTAEASIEEAELLSEHAEPSVEELEGVLERLQETDANCLVEARRLTQRKDALLVELAELSDSLEALHLSRESVLQMRKAMVDQLTEADPDRALLIFARLGLELPPEQPQESQVGLDRTPAQPHEGEELRKQPLPKSGPRQAAPDPSQPEPELTQRQQRELRRAEQRQQRKHSRRQAAQLCEPCEGTGAAGTPGPGPLQLFVGGLPRGIVASDAISAAIEAAFRALPDYDASLGAACTRVQSYSNYAFVTLRDATLAATAPMLPPFPVSGARQLVRMARPRYLPDGRPDGRPGGRADGQAERLADGESAEPTPPPLHVPAELSFALPTPDSSATADGGLVGETMEARLYWGMRHAEKPRPNEKEVRESLAVFKQVNKLLKGKKVLFDVCGSHGLLAALFLAYGKAA